MDCGCHTSEKLQSVAQTFQTQGRIISISHIKKGHINDTYKVTYISGERTVSYVLQRINSSVFSDPIKIMENIEAVTAHIGKKYDFFGWDRDKVLFPLKTMNDTTYYLDSEGSYWRMYSYIEGGVCYDKAPNAEVMRAVGRAFGMFQMLLSDFPVNELNITIPDFHNTIKRFADLYKAAKLARETNKGRERLNLAKDVLDILYSHRSDAFVLETLKVQGKIPLRVTHNDTKCNNVMLDSITNESLAVIDLDTVMPGLCAHDFGDAVRAGANNADEDEVDEEKIYLDMEKFEAFAQGFIPALEGNITDAEYDSLAYGAPAIAFELSARFLCDYLNGDLYFKTEYSNHNLDRARCQAYLALDMLDKIAKMKQIINNLK